MLDIVMINDEFMHMFIKRLAQYVCELSSRHYVSMVLTYYLPADALCTLGHVVDHGCDTPIESFVVVHTKIWKEESGNSELLRLYHQGIKQL